MRYHYATAASQWALSPADRCYNPRCALAKGRRIAFMPAHKSDQRTARLAAALKENLKRRKRQARVKAGTDAPEEQTLDVAREAGPENKPEPGPKSAPKRG